jgi:hypothetical protein
MNERKVDGDPIGKNKKATSRVALDLKYPWVLQRQSYWHHVARQDKIVAQTVRITTLSLSHNNARDADTVYGCDRFYRHQHYLIVT